MISTKGLIRLAWQLAAAQSVLLLGAGFALLPAVIVAFAIAGCTLQFAANGTLPDSEKTIYVSPFQNLTRVPGANDQFTQYLKEQISSRKRLVVGDNNADADLTLSGSVLYYGTSATVFNSVYESMDYADMMTVQANLVDRRTGKVIWHSDGISSHINVPVVSQAIIPTTPQFLQQNLRGRDFANMPDIRVAATQQATAQQQVMTQLASELYTDIAWGF